MQHSNNNSEDFSDKEIIRNFHWLLSNGLSLDEAVKTIKEQTDHKSVTKYLDSYVESNK